MSSKEAHEARQAEKHKYVNSKDAPMLTLTQKNKLGFSLSYHTSQCSFEDHGTSREVSNHHTVPPVQRYWCRTHGQWFYQFPSEVQFTFPNGEVVTKKRA